MTVLATLTFNGISEGGTINNAALPAAWTTANSTFTALASAAKHGARGARIDNATAGRITYEEASTSADRVASGYYRLIDNPAQTLVAEMSASGTNRADWRVNTDRTVTLRNAFSAVATSVVALTLGVWYRWEWKTGTGGQELRFYIGEGSTPIFTLTGALTNAARTRLAFGVMGSGGSRDFEMDTLRIADDWVGAFVAPEAIAVATDVVATTAIATKKRVKGAVTVPAASALVVAPRARRVAAVTAAAVSAVAVAGRARRKAAVTAAASTTVGIVPRRVSEIAVLAQAVSTVAVSVRARRKASVSAAAVSATSIAPRGRFRGGVTIAPAVTVGIAPRLIARMLLLVQAVTTTTVGAVGRFLTGFTVPVLSESMVALYTPPPPIVHPLGLTVDIPTRELTVQIPTRGLAVDVPTRTLEWSLP